MTTLALAEALAKVDFRIVPVQDPADLLADLESIQRGEPPLRARKRYDPDILQSIADSGEVIASEPAAEEPSTPPTNLLVWLFVLGALLGISVIGNLVLAFALLS